MASAYSNWVYENNSRKSRAYVNAYIESQTDKTATIYVYGCVNASYISSYGVAVSITGGAYTEVVLRAPNSSSMDFGGISNRIVVQKSSSAKSQVYSCSIWGKTVSGYGPISGSATASVTLTIPAATLRPPSAPSNLTGKRNAAASIDLTWKNNATNATWTQIQRMQKGGSWVTIYDKTGVITSYTDNPGIGSFKYRVRHWNADGYSGYSNETDYIITLCPPAAPSIVSPPPGSTVSVNEGEVALVWRHNSIDTSPQSGAELQWAVIGEDWTHVTVGAEEELVIPLLENGEINWQVRTKGAYEEVDEGYGPWSAISSFKVRTAPVATLEIDSPVTAVPIPVSWTYDDAMGTQIAAELTVLDASEKEVFKKTLGSEKEYTISAAELTPIHGATYTVVLKVTSSTSLTYTTQTVFLVEYEAPSRPIVSTEIDSTSASVTITVIAGGGEIQTSEMYVFRDGVLIGEGLQTGQSVIDKIPPLDCSVEYRVVAYAPSGAVSDTTETLIVHSRGFCFFNFNDSYAKFAMNIDETDKTEHERELLEVASSEFPKPFFGKGKRRVGQEVADVWWLDDLSRDGQDAMLNGMKRLKEYNGVVYMRKPFDDAFHVVCDVDYRVSAQAGTVASVTVNWERCHV